METQKLQRLFIIATVISGVAAAYLMYRRGEPFGKIAQKAISHPVGSLASEVENAVQSGHLRA